jgi:hypothetical protein
MCNRRVTHVRVGQHVLEIAVCSTYHEYFHRPLPLDVELWRHDHQIMNHYTKRHISVYHAMLYLTVYG